MYAWRTILALAWVGLFTLSANATTVGLVGLWEFEDGFALGKATIGNDLVLNNANGTIAPITALGGSGGARVGVGDYFTAAPDIAANGGGSFVNQYTVVWDVLAPSLRSGDNANIAGAWRSFLQTNASNTNDGDYWINSGNKSLGVASSGTNGFGYSTGTIALDTWYRIVLSADIGQAVSFQTTVIDTSGNVLFTHNHAAQNVDGRHSIYPIGDLNTVHWFADENGEDEEMWVGQIALYDRPLSLSEAASLGAPGTAIPEPSGLALGGLALSFLAAMRRRRGTIQK